jgi:hypothetical protein
MSMFQSLVDNVPISRDLLVKHVPAAYHNDFDYWSPCSTGT